MESSHVSPMSHGHGYSYVTAMCCLEGQRKEPTFTPRHPTTPYHSSYIQVPVRHCQKNTFFVGSRFKFLNAAAFQRSHLKFWGNLWHHVTSIAGRLVHGDQIEALPQTLLALWQLTVVMGSAWFGTHKYIDREIMLFKIWCPNISKISRYAGLKHGELPSPLLPLYYITTNATTVGKCREPDAQQAPPELSPLDMGRPEVSTYHDIKRTKAWGKCRNLTWIEVR
jgi:hypothetical protein